MRPIVYIAFLFFLCLPVCGQPASGLPYQAGPDTMRTDTLRADSLLSSQFEKGKIKIVKRDINPRKYILLAVGMMVFLALILTTVQTWNPG
jgi:hypothetical protein